jgi:hypothetical protein
VPSSFRSCHHFSFLSIISKISPLGNEISLASSGDDDAVSMVHLQIKCERETVLTRTYIHAFVLYGYAGSEATLESAGNGVHHLYRCLHCPGVHQVRVDAHWAAYILLVGRSAIPRWSRAGQGADRSGALLRVRLCSWHVHVMEWTVADIWC